MKSRNLFKCICTYCGSSYEVRFDTANEEYICEECLDNEYEDALDKDGETNEQPISNVHKKQQHLQLLCD